MLGYKDLYNIMSDSFDEQTKVERLIDQLDDITDLYYEELEKRKYFQGAYNALKGLVASEVEDEE